jgi:hypothetical protein
MSTGHAASNRNAGRARTGSDARAIGCTNTVLPISQRLFQQLGSSGQTVQGNHEVVQDIPSQDD